MFRHFLGPISFNSLKGPVANKQASLPIIFGGIKIIPIVTIAPATYLGNWAFIASFIIVRFMVDQHPLLLEALAQVDNNSFPFQ
jgi:hypothetical protein